MKNNISAYGIFKNRSHVEEGISRLRTNGFRPEDVSVLFPETLGTKDIGIENATKSPEGAAAGGAAGVVAGGVLGWLVGIGMLAIPGVGPLVAAGPIVAALAGMGAGATVGGVTGALVGFGMPEYEATRYEGHMKNGGILVSVHGDTSVWADRAKEVLKLAGAVDISSSGEAAAEYQVSDQPLPLPVVK